MWELQRARRFHLPRAPPSAWVTCGANTTIREAFCNWKAMRRQRRSYETKPGDNSYLLIKIWGGHNDQVPSLVHSSDSLLAAGSACARFVSLHLAPASPVPHSRDRGHRSVRITGCDHNVSGASFARSENGIVVPPPRHRAGLDRSIPSDAIRRANQPRGGRLAFAEVERSHEASARGIDFFLKLNDCVKERLGPRWAAGDINVDGNHLIHALDDRIVVEDTARSGARTH